MKFKDLVKILPEDLQPTISPDNVVVVSEEFNEASWVPVSPDIELVTIQWDDIEYLMEINLASGKGARQIGTLNLLEYKAKKRKETIEDAVTE